MIKKNKIGKLKKKQQNAMVKKTMWKLGHQLHKAGKKQRERWDKI